MAQSNGLNETVRNLTKGDATGATTSVALQNFKFSTPLPANVTFATATCGPLPSGVTSYMTTTPAAGGPRFASPSSEGLAQRVTLYIR